MSAFGRFQSDQGSGAARTARGSRSAFIVGGFFLLAIVFGLSVAISDLAAAQEADGSLSLSAEELSRDRVFHVEVTGVPATGSSEITRSGKAFAVGPNILITARHVVGSNGDWKPADAVPEEIARVTRRLQRVMSLTRVKEYDPVDLAPPTKRVFVVPPLSEELDAVIVSAPELKVHEPFRLSFCDIVAGKNYRVLLTEDDPTQRESLGKPVAVDLVARGYKPDEFGSLYVFEPSAGQNFSKEPNGNGGAPIVDAAGDVVAMVSAVYTQNATYILATPITPQIPGASNFLARIPGVDGQDTVQCSLGQTVRKIYDRVASQYYWAVEVTRAEDGTIEKIVVSYDDPTSETAMPSVKILPTFYGITKNFQDKPETIPDVRPHEEQYLTSASSYGSRTYEFGGLKQIGSANYQRDANNIARKCTEQKCGIKFLRIDIFPQVNERLSSDLIDEGKYLRRPITRSFPWVARQ